MILCQVAPDALVRVFSKDPAVIGVGEEYLRLVSLGFGASGLTFVASSMFQAMGNTVPSLITSAVRILLVGIPAVLLARAPIFALNWIWYLSLGSVLVSARRAGSRRELQCRTRAA